MIKVQFVCTVLVVVFFQFSFGRYFNATKALNDIRSMQETLIEAGDELEDILDNGLTPLVDYFNSFLYRFEDYLHEEDEPEPLYE